MDNMAKNVIKNEQSMTNGQITAIIVKNKYQNNQSQPLGHEALQTETDNVVNTDQNVPKTKSSN